MGMAREGTRRKCELQSHNFRHSALLPVFSKKEKEAPREINETRTKFCKKTGKTLGLGKVKNIIVKLK